MTAKTVRFDARGVPQKMQGWHSWRHETREAQDVARARYLSQHGPAARRARALNRPTFPHGAERFARGCTCDDCYIAARQAS